MNVELEVEELDENKSGGVRARVDSKHVGFLSYTWTAPDLSVDLEEIYVLEEELKRRGIGRMMIEAFINKVGHGRSINAAVIHLPTFEFLRDLNLLPSEGESFPITDASILERVPIIKFLESGGISVTSFKIYYITENDNLDDWDSHYGAEVQGVTR